MSTEHSTHTAHSKPQNAPQAHFICKGTSKEERKTEILCKSGITNPLRLEEKKISRMAVEHQLVTQNNTKISTIWNSNPGSLNSHREGVCRFLPPSQDHFLHKSESHNKTTWVSKWSRVTLHHSLLWQRSLWWWWWWVLQRQTRVSSRRESGIRHERGWATSSSLERK